ncbi:hypothetical protein ALC62_00384, partial [Cyphomyrmex costatus]
RLNFLDTTVIVDYNNSVIFNRYHKSTFSSRFLSYHFHHPIETESNTTDRSERGVRE